MDQLPSSLEDVSSCCWLLLLGGRNPCAFACRICCLSSSLQDNFELWSAAGLILTPAFLFQIPIFGETFTFVARVSLFRVLLQKLRSSSSENLETVLSIEEHGGK